MQVALIIHTGASGKSQTRPVMLHRSSSSSESTTARSRSSRIFNRPNPVQPIAPKLKRSTVVSRDLSAGYISPANRSDEGHDEPARETIAAMTKLPPDTVDTAE